MELQNVADNLAKRGFKVKVFETGAEAAEFVNGLCAGKTVGMGGCKTAAQIGLIKMLNENATLYSHSYDNSPNIYQKAATAEVYITSVNGMTEAGQLINIDGRGNRVSATLFGPKTLFFLIGRNKIEETYEKALWRARNIAAPLNAKRLNRQTPCALAEEMRCYDCSSPDRICNGFVTHERPMRGMETYVILINEDLGL